MDILTKSYIPEAIYTSQSWPLFVPCQETYMAAVQNNLRYKATNKTSRNLLRDLKYENEIIFVLSFVFIGLFLRPRCFHKEA